MQIKEVCRECGLTKKAVEYYEKQGLIQPYTEDNGYRNYNSDDVTRLKEIAVLRSLGISINNIRSILANHNKAAALLRCRELIGLEQERLSIQCKGIELLAEQYDVDRTREYLLAHLEPSLILREKLMQAFPGAYGVYLSLHFGRFLNEATDSPEKETAYRNILAFLDEAPALTDELACLIEDNFPVGDKATLAGLDASIMEALTDTEGYIEQNADTIATYLEWLASEDYKTSPAYHLKKMLLSYQKNYGYQDVFIANLKIISPAYNVYMETLEAANARFLARYPQAERLITPKSDLQ